MKLLYLLLILLTFAPFGLQADDKTSPNPATKTLVWPDGTRYVGGVKEGKRKGRGTIFWQDGTRFVGQFETVAGCAAVGFCYYGKCVCREWIVINNFFFYVSCMITTLRLQMSMGAISGTTSHFILESS